MGQRFDNQALELLRNREPEAIQAWFERYADSVYTFVYYRVGKDEQAASDVVQETFLDALTRIEQYDPERGSMEAWLMTLSRNFISKALKAKGMVSLDRLWSHVDKELFACFEQLATEPLPQDVLEKKETEDLVHMPADRKADVLSRLLQKAATSTEDERASMSWIKWAVAAMVLLAVVFSICFLDKSGVAFADILKEVQEDPNRYQSQHNFLLGPVETLWGLVDGTEQSIGRTIKDGIEVIGYRVEKTSEILNQEAVFIYTIWANVSTALPHEVTMEVKDPTGENEGFVILLRDFDFNAAIDESLFGLSPKQELKDVTEGQFIVRPGVGMGELHFGDPSDKVTKILGKPDFMIGEGLYQYTGLVVVAREGKVYSFQGGDANGPGTRHAQQCRLRTADGVGMGSSEQEIVEVYGEPTRRTIQQGDVHIGYRSKGMGFILRDNKVYLMSFGNPRQKK